MLPTFKEYSGGGSILSVHTTPENIINECKQHNCSVELIRNMIDDGFEVIILHGEIKAAQKSEHVKR